MVLLVWTYLWVERLATILTLCPWSSCFHWYCACQANWKLGSWKVASRSALFWHLFQWTESLLSSLRVLLLNLLLPRSWLSDSLRHPAYFQPAQSLCLLHGDLEHRWPISEHFRTRCDLCGLGNEKPLTRYIIDNDCDWWILDVLRYQAMEFLLASGIPYLDPNHFIINEDGLGQEINAYGRL